MMNDNPAAQESARPQSRVLYVLSEVPAENMAKFMNSITWMAAWLRHCHGWTRLFVGCALTDVPEQVLEIYYIPNDNVSQAEKILELLHAHEEYETLLSYYDSPEKRREMLMYVTDYKSILRDFIRLRDEEAAVGEGIKEAVRRRLAGERKADGLELFKRRRAIKANRRRIAEGVPLYFLYATFDVKKGKHKWKRFVGSMSSLSEEFDKKLGEEPDFALVAAVRWGKHMPIPGQSGNADHGVLNLWNFEDANELYRQMVHLRENERYTTLTKFVQKEWQMLMCDWEVVSKTMRKGEPPRRRTLDEGGACVRPAGPGPDDLVIFTRHRWVAEEGRKVRVYRFHWLRRSDYEQHVAPPSVAQRAQELVAKGVVMAGMRTSGGKGRAFFVNLSALPRGSRGQVSAPPEVVQSRKEPDVPPRPESEGLESEDLVILDRDGTRFYLVKKDEYRKTMLNLSKLEPFLSDQLRLLTNQGVVLADVPGGSIPDVKSMGCLVNLTGIKGFRSEQEKKVESTPAPAPQLH